MIRGQKRALDKRPSVNVDLNASIHNRFDIEVVDAKTGEVKQKAQAENVICNQLWPYLFTNSDGTWNNYIHYGSGKGTPSVSDTALFNYKGYIGSFSEKTIKNDTAGVFSYTKKGSLSESTAVGVEITELGLAYSTGQNYLCTHAMLQDMNGNQISILKTDTDIINIYATVYVHYNTAGYSGIFIAPQYSRILNNTLLGILMWLAAGKDASSTNASTFPNHYIGAAGTLYQLPTSGGSHAWFQQMSASFNVSAKTVKVVGSRVTASAGNSKKNIYWVIAGVHNSYFREPAIIIPSKTLFPSGTQISGESIGTGDGETVDFKTAFPGISNCTVYVDGVAQNSVSVDNNVPFVLEQDYSLLLEYYWQDKDGTVIPSAYNENRTIDLYPGDVFIVRNPFFSKIKITSMNLGNYSMKVEASSDCKNWTDVLATSTSVTVPAEHQNAEWFRFTNSNYDTKIGWPNTTFNVYVDRGSDENIHFSTPPASGAVITADYTTEVIAKDENHVFDFSMTIQLGEYTE